MRYCITAPQPVSCHIELPASKSVSNRAIIIDALSGGRHNIENVAVCNDTRAMVDALSSTQHTVDVGDAGTAMRFLTAYYAITPGKKIITGSPRMLQRPIAPLVDALRQLGASITYIGKEGYPPLSIEGRQLRGGNISIRGDVSSQFITALLLISPYMQEGLSLTIEGNILSRPYIAMTVEMMRYYDIYATYYDNRIDITPGQYNTHKHFTIPFDWSSASYWYEIAYLNRKPYYFNGFSDCNDGSSYYLNSFYNNAKLDYFISSSNQESSTQNYYISSLSSLQGDSRVAEYFKILGLDTLQEGNHLTINPALETALPHILTIDMTDTPDLAQTIIVGCVLRKQFFSISGLDNLPIKETNRIEALISETAKLGAILSQPAAGTLQWLGESCPIHYPIIIDTHNDHRMAMAFAPAAITHGEVWIDNPQVVEKSYPGYWHELTKAGFCITPQQDKETQK